MYITTCHISNYILLQPRAYELCRRCPTTTSRQSHHPPPPANQTVIKSKPINTQAQEQQFVEIFCIKRQLRYSATGAPVYVFYLRTYLATFILVLVHHRRSPSITIYPERINGSFFLCKVGDLKGMKNMECPVPQPLHFFDRSTSRWKDFSDW